MHKWLPFQNTFALSALLISYCSLEKLKMTSSQRTLVLDMSVMRTWHPYWLICCVLFVDLSFIYILIRLVEMPNCDCILQYYKPLPTTSYAPTVMSSEPLPLDSLMSSILPLFFYFAFLAFYLVIR